ncbi:MAG: amidohydrolase family protein [Nisaea sp.]|nr:amidohydrolase family protein [Nisaea sp.]
MNNLEVVDSHHHLWNLDCNYYPWLVDKEEHEFFLGDYSSLKKNYMPNNYQADSKKFNVIATVHVEAEWDRFNQVGETNWLTKVNAQFGMPNAIVGHVWLAAKNCEDVLKGHQKYPLFKGVRSKPITSLNPNDQKPKGRGSMHDEAWRNGLAILAEYNLSFDLRVPYWHLYEAAQIISELPKLSVVLNHTGFPWDRSPRGLSEWRHAMKVIAQCPNVFLKLSELGLKDAAWTVDNNRGVVLDAIDIFGVERCMWASNFPVAGLRVSYENQLTGMLEILGHLSRTDIDKIFKFNAAQFYKIDLSEPAKGR